MFRRCRVSARILGFYETARHCAAIYGFGGYSFRHCWHFSYGCFHPADDGELLPLGLGADTPWPRGA